MKCDTYEIMHALSLGKTCAFVHEICAILKRLQGKQKESSDGIVTSDYVAWVFFPYELVSRRRKA